LGSGFSIAPLSMRSHPSHCLPRGERRFDRQTQTMRRMAPSTTQWYALLPTLRGAGGPAIPIAVQRRSRPSQKRRVPSFALLGHIGEVTPSLRPTMLKVAPDRTVGRQQNRGLNAPRTRGFSPPLRGASKAPLRFGRPLLFLCEGARAHRAMPPRAPSVEQWTENPRAESNSPR